MVRSESISARITRAVITTSVSQIAVVALAFATSIAQARLLGADGRGELARFVNAGALIVLYFGLGINSAITYFVASGAAGPRDLFHALRPIFALTLVAVPISAALVSITSLERFLPQGVPVPWVVLCLTLFFAFSQAGSWLSALLAARGNFASLNSSAVAIAAIGAVVSAILLWLAPTWADAWTIIAMVVGLEGLRALMLLVSVARGARAPAHPEALAFRSPLGRGVTVSQLWRYSGLSFVADALQFLTYRLDMWVVDAYHGTAELGRYALAVSLAQLVWVVPAATARVLFPYAAMMDSAQGSRLALRAAIAAFLVSGILAVVGWVGSQFFLTGLFGEQFAAVPALIGILLLGVVPYSSAKVLANYLAGINAVGVNAIASAGVLGFTIVLDLLLIPTLGATGAALATAASYATHTVILIAIFLRKTGTSLRRAPRVLSSP